MADSVGAITAPDAFPAALAGFGPDPLIVCHNDADGLSAGAILAHALERAGHEPGVRILGRGENAYSREFAAELERLAIGGVILADVGTAESRPREDVPGIVVDHHAPSGWPEDATVVSGIADDPVPTTSLLAFRCAQALGKADDLLWLAAIGLIGDMAEEAGFPEMAEARSRCGITALRKAVSLVNAPRRTASGDAGPALRLLRAADGPKDVLSGVHPETAILEEAKREVRAELDRARKVPPRVAGEVAILRFSSPCQIHPLVAQAWRGRLGDWIVIAANTGYRDGFVHFAARTATHRDLIAFFRDHRPAGADEQYGNGHRAASGGALRAADWNAFVRGLGFGAEMEIA